MKKTYKIPKCLYCKKVLTEVYEITYEKYLFNKKTGRYEEFGFGGELEIKCPYCDTHLEDIFEEGACNYQAERRK